MTDVAIIDNGGANIASLRHALERLGASSVLTTDVAILRGAPRVLLPGVGAAADAMERLRAAGLVEAIRVLEQPVLGICLGMQLLFGRSEEGDTACPASSMAGSVVSPTHRTFRCRTWAGTDSPH